MARSSRWFLAALLAASVPASADDRVVGLWHFDEGWGGFSRDETGNNDLNDGAFGWGEGKFGPWALDLSSDDARTLGPSKNLPTGNSPRTISAWIYPTAWQHQWHTVLCYGTESPSLGNNLTITSDGFLYWAFYSNDIGSSYQVPLDRWTHVAGTWDGSTVRFYADGRLVGQGPLGAADTIESLPLKIGNLSWVPWDVAGFIGRIDEAKVMNVALSAEEILADAQAGGAGVPIVPSASDRAAERANEKSAVIRGIPGKNR